MFCGKSYAKINLFLRVFGKEDGFHLLDSVFAFLDICDDISIKKSTEFKVNISGEHASFVDHEKNIFSAIASYFKQGFNIHDNVEIDLTKNIPVEAGLGGGSSNGACLIKYFNNEYSLGLNFKELQEISFKFGSDIAFFLQDKASIVKNRGEVICKVKEFDPIDAILIIPNFGLSTKDVFGKFDGNFSQEIKIEDIANKSTSELIADYKNDLFAPACEIKPELREIYDFAKSIGVGDIKMSGTGSTMFAIVAYDKSEETLNELKKRFIDYRIIKSKVLYELPL